MRWSSPQTFFWNSLPSLASGRSNDSRSPAKYSVSWRSASSRSGSAARRRRGTGVEVDGRDQSGVRVQPEPADRRVHPSCGHDGIPSAVLAQTPEVERGVGAPRLPGGGAGGVDAVPVEHPPDVEVGLEHHVGMPERPHDDVVGRPRPDAADARAGACGCRRGRHRGRGRALRRPPPERRRSAPARGTAACSARCRRRRPSTPPSRTRGSGRARRRGRTRPGVP